MRLKVLERAPVGRSIDIRLSLRTMIKRRVVSRTLFSASSAIPLQIEASPIMATTCSSGDPIRSRAAASPRAAEIVLPA